MKIDKKNILIICKTSLHNDPRVLKQIEGLHKKYNITCVGVEKSNVIGVAKDLDVFIAEKKINKFIFAYKLITKQYSSIYWNDNHKLVYKTISKEKYSLIICNEIVSLPIADKLAKSQSIPIYCDLHEFYLIDKNMGSLSKYQFNFDSWLLLNHKSKIQHFSTVSPQIVNLYKEKYNIECSLINNATKYFDLQPSALKNNKIKMVSHGAAIPSRRIETMIYAMQDLNDNYSLDLYLQNNNRLYLNELKEIANKFPNVNIFPAIPFVKIQETINKYDIGVYSLFPKHLNNKFALPNKLFEFIQGRVAIVIGPTPAMVEIVKKYNIGAVALDFSAKQLAHGIQKLSIKNINQYKQNTNKAALELNSEKNINQIRKIVAKLID